MSLARSSSSMVCADEAGLAGAGEGAGIRSAGGGRRRGQRPRGGRGGRRRRRWHALGGRRGRRGAADRRLRSGLRRRQRGGGRGGQVDHVVERRAGGRRGRRTDDVLLDDLDGGRPDEIGVVPMWNEQLAVVVAEALSPCAQRGARRAIARTEGVVASDQLVVGLRAALVASRHRQALTLTFITANGSKVRTTSLSPSKSWSSSAISSSSSVAESTSASLLLITATG